MRAKKQDLQFDEFAPDMFSAGGELDYVERPIKQAMFLLVGFGAFLVFMIVFSRLMFLAAVKGGFYEARAQANVNQQKVLPAHRGVITDRYGTVLARNTETFSVFLTLSDLLKDRVAFENTLARLAEALAVPVEDLRAEIAKVDFETAGDVAVARNVSPEQAIAVKTLALESVHVENDFRREYVEGEIFSQIIGYTGMSETDDSIVGKSGLERFYDGDLRGRDGVYTYVRNALGEVLDERVTLEPISGNTLTTTIDAGLQTYFYNRLEEQLNRVGSGAGAGIAIDPRTGEILALVSLPSYDNNVFVTPGKSAQRSALFEDGMKPLFNRAIFGAYSPGSTIKPLVALAGLHEGVVDPVYGVYSPGYLDIPNPFSPDKPTRFLDWKAHGWVNVRSALARSSNVYFYVVGGGFPAQGGSASGVERMLGLGIDRLQQYWQLFGFGSGTGVDFVGESTGFLPGAAEKEKRTGQPWRIGDTYNVSIGQGDFLVSPLQLLRFIASIADNGAVRRPHFVSEIEAPDGAKTIARAQDVNFDYSSWEMELEEVRTGMEHGVSKDYGTSHMLSTLPMSAAGKTGSAQINNNTATNAFFVGYAPANPEPDEPQVAILILIERAKEGSLNAVPVAYDVFNWFYENRVAE